MWADPVTRMDPADIPGRLGGNLGGLGNYCCIRVSHALITAGHPITTASDYRDAAGNKYIIRVATMKSYLTSKYGAPIAVTAASAAGKKGIIVFDVSGWSDATGHADLWNGSTCAYRSYWSEASAAHLWTC